jgi:hypothetical protein
LPERGTGRRYGDELNSSRIAAMFEMRRLARRFAMQRSLRLHSCLENDVNDAFVAEARNRGARRIWVASYDFQAPGMYEKAGFKRMAEFEEWPEGHINVILCKILSSPEAE